MAVEPLHIGEEGLVLGAEPAAFGEHPVGYASVAHLTVAERAKAQYHRHVLLLADLKEATQVALSVPAETSFPLLDVVPEDVGGDHGQSPLLHLPHFPLPLVSRYAGIMNLTHDRADAASVEHKAVAVPRDGGVGSGGWLDGFGGLGRSALGHCQCAAERHGGKRIKTFHF